MKTQPMLGLFASALVLGMLSAPAYAAQFTIDPRDFAGFDDGPTAPLNSLGWELRTATTQFGTSSGENWLPDGGSRFLDIGFGRIDAYNPYDIGDDQIAGIRQRDMTLRWDNIAGTLGADGQLSYESGTIDFYFGGDGIGSGDLRSSDPFDTNSAEWQAAGSGEHVLSMELSRGDALARLITDDDGNLEAIDATQFDLFFDITFAREGFWALTDSRPFEELIGLQLISAFGEAGGATQRNTVLNDDENAFTDADIALYTHYAGVRRGSLEFQVPEPSTLMLMGGSLILLALATGGFRRRQSESGGLAAS
ncbi:PEP-CTERM sorting domain-containing protein [Halorhodospira halophila]|uniref:Uncharacterized protein n=1 Tax=Halorhodospira halophila (strain DSM 244 / SL1) TaxID=349124 RepID=A1WX84_HALHL|nr:PEP-CTERM sorting domain-containing protein [Halorhodospira halophila]ABM62296.1 hypothetical protein Hhal_1529 [Halorhodospira halophila SL1]MBK1729271.1 PEP-CTERM sorting domain-containing protein [Halorhodospira halophila]